MEKKNDLNGYEKEVFIQNPTPAVQYKNSQNYEQGNSSSGCCGRKCCCCKTSWKCCAIVTAVILLVFGGIVLGGYLYFKSRMTGTASSENAEETEKMLTQSASASVGDDGDLISGEYLLTSYDQNYPEYLTAIGIPSFVVNMFILASKEIIKVSKTGNHIKFTTMTDGDVVTREAEFTLGEMAEIPYGRKLEGIMHTMCDLKAPNHLFCTSTERTKGWTLTSEHIFSKAGVLNKRHHVSKDITTKKMYLRQGVVVNVEDQESMNLEGMVTVPPKVESDDPFSNSNDDEDSFFNDNEDSEDDFFNDDDDEDNTWG